MGSDGRKTAPRPGPRGGSWWERTGDQLALRERVDRFLPVVLRLFELVLRPFAAVLRLFDVVRLVDFLGTLPPSRRASESPIAIACLRLVTFLPERPDLSVPCFRSCIAFSTFDCDFLPYLAMGHPPSMRN